MRLSATAAALAKKVAGMGNANSITDAGVACLAAKTAYTGAMMNVLINLSSIKDQEFVESTRQSIEKIFAEAEDATAKTLEHIRTVCGNRHSSFARIIPPMSCRLRTLKT